MNNKQSEEKQRIFLNMLDHPEKYTTKEIEALLADEEISSFASMLSLIVPSELTHSPAANATNTAPPACGQR